MITSINVNLKLKNTTESSTSAAYLVCYHCIEKGKLVTRLYDKRDDFNFPIVNFPVLVAIFLRHLHTEFVSLN